MIEKVSKARPEQLRVRAKTLPVEKRKNIIHSLLERDLHKCLARMLSRVYPESIVEITHGSNEFGKDLVLVHKDPIRQSAIGIVVKRGDRDQKIRGNTAGPIDEIKSQVEQAFSNPGNTRTYFKNVPVTEVWVILAGEITGNAKDRLRNEIQREIPFFDIAWLVEMLTEHYPEAFFGGEVTNTLEGKIEELELGPVYKETGQVLSEVFVPPRLVRIESREIEENDGQHITRFEISMGKLEDVLVHDHCSFLLGGPGAGKSLALQKLALDKLKLSSSSATRTASKDKRLGVPVLIEALDANAIDEPEELIASWFPAELHDRLAVDTLLVDGLEDIPLDERGNLLRRLQEIAVDLDVRLVVTSRVVPSDLSFLEGFGVYSIQPFTYQQSMTLLRKLVSDERKVEVLKTGLVKYQDKLPMTPLALKLLIRLLEERQEVPASIAELYEQFTDLALGKFDSEKGIASIFDWQVKKRFLAHLAYNSMLESSRAVIPRADFDCVISEYAHTYELAQDRIDDLVDELNKSCIIEVGRTVSFSHRSFLDFYAGLYIYDHQSDIRDIEDTVVTRYYDEWGEDAALFYVGLKRELSADFLDQFLSRPEPTESSDSRLSHEIRRFMLGRLLQAAWHSGARVKEKGIRGCLREVPALRSNFDELTTTALPAAMTDLILLMLARQSFGSTFLKSAAQRIIAEAVEKDSPNADSLLCSTILLWGVAEHLERPQRGALVQSLEVKVSAAEMDAVDKARLLLMLRLPAAELGSAARAIERRIKKMAKRAPGVFRAILPSKKRGKAKRRWRRESRK